MNGRDLLADLLGIAHRQRAALAVDDLAEFENLAERRAALVAALESADWTDPAAAVPMAQAVLACDEQNVAVLRERMAAVAQELADVRRGGRALSGYRGVAEVDRQTARLLDRSA